MAGRGIGRPAGLWPRSFQVRNLGGQLTPSGSASTFPWYGRACPGRHWGRAPCDRSVSGQHPTLPRSERQFESGRSLSGDQAPRSYPHHATARLPVPGRQHEPDRTGLIPGHAPVVETGRHASLRNWCRVSGVRVRIPPGARGEAGESRPCWSARTSGSACPRPLHMEHWLSGYSSAPLRRTPGIPRCEGSSPSCSAQGWFA